MREMLISKRRWKVAKRTENGKLVSEFVTGPLAITYEPWEWVEAPVGGILVYADPYWALHNCRLSPCPNLEVWEVIADEPVKLPFWALCEINNLARDRAEACWNGNVLGEEVGRWPHATEAYRRIKLTRKIVENSWFVTGV